jgi:hypothetical protein
VEALNKKTGQWECFGVSTAIRNYALFSKIADERNSEDEKTYIEPIVEPRGWPMDATGPANTWRDMDGCSFSETWLNRAELELLDKWVLERWQEKDLWKILGFDHFSYLFNMKGSWKKAAFTRYSDLRVLFFFTR